MVNKCVVFGCKSGYASISTDNVSAFRFPFEKQVLLEKWTRFVNRADWLPSKNSVICSNHFEEKFLHKGKRTKLKWNLNPIPSIHTANALKRPSTLQTPSAPRKPPKSRIYAEDQFESFSKNDTIKDFDDLSQKQCPAGYLFRKASDHVIYYKVCFDENSGFPVVKDAIKIDGQLHVELRFCDSSVPLPQWFTVGRNAKLTSFSMLHNFPAYLQNLSYKADSLLKELQERQHYSPKGRPPYSSEMMRFALHLRYTSGQAYKLLLEKFPLPSLSLLKRLKSGSLDILKAAKILREKGSITDDIVLISDEMYIKKSVQYAGGRYIGTDETGNLYKGVVVFMVQGLKQSVPVVVRASPETTLSGKWLAEEFSECMSGLIQAGFTVRGIVTDNHSANVAAFNRLLEMYPSGNTLFIQHPQNSSKTHLFFDNVHLLKNVRNNLLNAQKFVFPSFSFLVKDQLIASSENGYISWRDIHSIYDADSKLKANLRKATKLTFHALHPGNNKQNVNLALAVFHETTIAACKTYFSDRKDMIGFLSLINNWWLIINSKQQFHPNCMGNAIVAGDGKTDFLNQFAIWLENWSKSGSGMFCLTKQTSDALIRTLRAQALLIEELLQEDYAYILTARLQSDSIERRFSQYRQLNGGNFLVSLKEVTDSEKTLLCRTLLKENINFFSNDSLKIVPNPELMDDLTVALALKSSELQEATLNPESNEVSLVVAGYVAKMLVGKSQCKNCEELLISNKTAAPDSYFFHLSRGGLTLPSESLAQYVANGFAVLDCADLMLQQYPQIPIRHAAQYVLQTFCCNIDFTCESHVEWGGVQSRKIIVNIFYNNKQKHQNDGVRKDALKAFKKRQREK